MSAASEAALTTSATLDEWLLRIEHAHPVKWDLGLSRVSLVARDMDLLQPAPKVVLVAGTNGKGSACEYLEHLALSAGLSTGKSTSPHFHRFNERIAIDGQPASDRSIINAFVAIDEARGATSLTYFEYATLASLLIFKAAGVALAILEIGLGGRLDAMNLVSPDLSLITSISLDHEAWLGNSREQIGAEKAGIMRPGIPCVIADPEPPASLLSISDTLGAPVKLLNRDFFCDPSEYPSGPHSEHRSESQPEAQSESPMSLQWSVSAADPGSSTERRLDDIPRLQLSKDSFAAAVQATAELGLVLSDQQIRQAATSACLPGRRQWLPGKCPVLLDVAHNPAATVALAAYVATWVAEHGAPARFHALAGIYEDKDISGMLGPLSALVDDWHFCDLEEARAASATRIAQIFTAEGHARVSTYASIEAALSRVQGQVEADDMLLIFGSFPMVAGAQKVLGKSGL